MKAQNGWVRFAGGVAVLTDAVILDNLFVSFSYIENAQFQSPGLLAWCLCALFVYCFNLFLLRKSRSLPFLAAVNVLLIAAALVILFRFTAILGGWMSGVFLVVFLLITLGRALYLVWNPTRLPSHLTHIDILCFSLFWLTLSAQPILMERPGHLFFLLAVLLLNLLCSVALRVGDGTGGHVLVGAPVAGGLLSAGLLASLLALLFLLVRILAGHSRSAVDAVLSGFAAVIRTLVRGLLAFLDWFMSLFPTPDEDMSGLDVAPGPAGVEAPPMEEIPLDPTLLYVLAVVVAVAAAAALLTALFRARHAKLSLAFVGGHARQQIRRKKLHGGFSRYLSRLLQTIRFRWLAFRYRNTPGGTLIHLEQKMKKAGAPRLPGETPRIFLCRISAELLPLADDLDRLYYAGVPCTLSAAACKSLRRGAVQTIRQQSLKQTPDPTASCDNTDTDPQ